MSSTKCYIYMIFNNMGCVSGGEDVEEVCLDDLGVSRGALDEMRTRLRDDEFKRYAELVVLREACRDVESRMGCFQLALCDGDTPLLARNVRLILYHAPRLNAFVWDTSEDVVNTGSYTKETCHTLVAHKALSMLESTLNDVMADSLRQILREHNAPVPA